MVKLDVTNESSVKDAVLAVEHQLQGKGLDYLVNNAGVSDWSPTGLEGMYVGPVGDQSLTPALLTK
jgi:NAD(P)-dependent dehydrogenase (short-subunit alcohol dehydrogenase family)